MTGSPPLPGRPWSCSGDAVAVLEARAALLAAAGKRGWPISPDMPALIILIDEYAELADEAPDAMSDTDSIARLGRAVAVTLIAATQRPTQKARAPARYGRKWTCGYASGSASPGTWT